MAGGGIAIAYDAKWVEKYLNAYDERVFADKTLEKPNADLALLDKCLSGLPSYERDLVTALCIKGVSEREYAARTGLTRYRVRAEKKRILDMTARVFAGAHAPKKQAAGAGYPPASGSVEFSSEPPDRRKKPNKF